MHGPNAARRYVLTEASGSVIARLPILLLEDQGDIAETLAEVLQGEGYQVTVATDTESALRSLETAPFALVLADFLCGAPEHSEEMAWRLLDAAGSIPVGCITGWRIPERLSVEYSFVLKKPFVLDELIETVGRFTLPWLEREGAVPFEVDDAATGEMLGGIEYRIE
jgi:CheY-like chemotaxis protein